MKIGKDDKDDEVRSNLVEALKTIKAKPEETSATAFGRLLATWMQDIPKNKMRDFQTKVLVFTDKYIKEEEQNIDFADINSDN